MKMTFEEAVTYISRYLSCHSHGVDFRNYYIGRTTDVATALFGYHGVNKDTGIYTTVLVDTPDEAKAVLQHYHALGMVGGIHDTEKDARTIYCYLVTMQTNEYI